MSKSRECITRSNLDDRKKKTLISSTGPLYTLLLRPLIYYRRNCNIFDVSVGKIKAILLLVPPVVQDREPKAGLSHGNRRCLDTNMCVLIESGSTRNRSQVSWEKVSIHADLVFPASMRRIKFWLRSERWFWPNVLILWKSFIVILSDYFHKNNFCNEN